MLGKLEAFDLVNGSWSEYVEILDQFFISNEVTAPEKRRAILLSCIGTKAYSLLRDLCAPTLPGLKTFAELNKLMSTHLNPKPLIIAERFKFHKRDQLATESIAQYVANLNKLTEFCDFNAFRDDALRDRFVCGLVSVNIQKELLSKSELTFAKAVQTALALEAAESNAVELQGNPAGFSNVNKLKHAKFSKGESSKAGPVLSKLKVVCYCCGISNHKSNVCKFKAETCRLCKKVGHLAKMCGKIPVRNAKPGFKRQTKHLNVQNHDSESDSSFDGPHSVSLHALSIGKVHSVIFNNKPRYITVNARGKKLKLEFDTGTEATIFPNSWYEKYFSDKELIPTKVKLTTWSREKFKARGVIYVDVTINGLTKRLRAIIAQDDFEPLCGREWINSLNLDWHNYVKLDTKEISVLKNEGPTHKFGNAQKPESKLSVAVNAHPNFGKNETKAENSTGVKKKSEPLGFDLSEFSELFSEGLGKLNDFKANISLKEGHTVKYFNPRPVPLAQRSKVENELNRLVKLGILSPVQYSEWATPIVVVPKEDGTVRVVGDYSVTVNPAMNVEYFPMPKAEDVFAELAGCTVFSKVDLTDAFLQMELEEAAKPILTINTHKGLFQWNRMPLGLASSPGIFQKRMEQILSGIPRSKIFIDDCLAAGLDSKMHDVHLKEVLTRLQDKGLKLKLSKCLLGQSEIKYLGYKIDGSGLHNLPETILAIQELPEPVNVTQLKSFLGFINQYGKFISHCATILAPLSSLLQKNCKWEWSKECRKAFKDIKKGFLESKVLTHYDDKLPLKLVCDASAYGVGAALLHVFPNGEEKPIAFASRTMSKTERNYAQFDKEALSIIFGVKKFHFYLYGRAFDLYTDHQALTWIFGSKKGIPVMAAARIQRWALFLAGYSFNIKHIKGHENLLADSLSRLPLPDQTASKIELVREVSVICAKQVEVVPILADQLSSASQNDPVLQRVFQCVQHGWPAKAPEGLMSFFVHRQEISCSDNILFWGLRIIIPEKLRHQVLQELHMGHHGVVKMKALARSHVWWPGLDTDIEAMVKICQECQENRDEAAKGPKHVWEFTAEKWERLHADFAGPFLGRMFLVVVDSYSKWPIIVEMVSTSTSATISELRSIFSTYGLPKIFVTDNGPQWRSEEFNTFMKLNGVKHITGAPYHPETNGLAENMVKTFKKSLKASKAANIPVSLALQQFLLTYRTTPHVATSESPSKLLWGRELRTRLTLLRPDSLQTKMARRQYAAVAPSSHRPSTSFEEGANVWTRDYRINRPRWQLGVISGHNRDSYEVALGNGNVTRRHLAQLRAAATPFTNRKSPPGPSSEPEGATAAIPAVDFSTPAVQHTPRSFQAAVPEVMTSAFSPPPTATSSTSQADDGLPRPAATEGRERPARQRRAPDRLNL